MRAFFLEHYTLYMHYYSQNKKRITMIRQYFIILFITTSLFSQNSVVQQFSKAFADVAENANLEIIHYDVSDRLGYV